MNEIFEPIIKATQDFNEYHDRALPLCAAENALSDFCKIPLSANFQERYIMGSAYAYSKNDNFVGSEMMLPYYKIIDQECLYQYHSKFNDVRTLTGMNCLTMILMVLTKPGDRIMILNKEWGGHASVKGICDRLGLDVYDIPYDHDAWDFDYDELNKQVKEKKIQFILPAPSDILFPFHVEKIDTSDVLLLYDTSQMLGMIGSGVIDNPLDVHGDRIVMFGGTHKTMPGPAHGMAFTNNEEIFKLLDVGINPKYLRNTQMHQVICLMFTLIEQHYYGHDYQANTVRIGNILGKALEKEGFHVVKKDGLYTQTHELFIECPKEEMDTIFDNGFKAGIAINTKKKALFHGGYGIRIGMQEVSRYDWDDAAIESIAPLIAEISHKKPDFAKVRRGMDELPEKRIKFTFPTEVVQELKKEMGIG